MKLTALLLTVILVGCASRGPSSQAISLQQLQAMKYTQADCPQIDQHVKFLETQLRLRGLANADPATLSEPDRVYNGLARVYIWNLRIGCTNPKRFAQK